MHQKTAYVYEIEFTHHRWIEVVHAHLAKLSRRAKRTARHLEPMAALLTPLERGYYLRSAVDWPVPGLWIQDVDGDYLSRTSSLHLECPEAVESRHVEAPHTG